MKKYDAAFLLKESIKQKEIECNRQSTVLKDQFGKVLENLTPAHLIENVINSPAVQDSVTDVAISMSTGELVKKIVVGSSDNSWLKLAGSLLQIGVTNVMVKNAGTIKTISFGILNKIFSKKEPVS